MDQGFDHEDFLSLVPVKKDVAADMDTTFGVVQQHLL